MISIAEQCTNRLSLGRDLQIGPGFIIRERKEDTRPTIIYLDAKGRKTTRAAIAKHYGVSYRCVSDFYLRNNQDWCKTHKALKARL